MFNVNKDWNPKQKRLNQIIRKSDCYKEARELFIEMHGMVHSGKVSLKTSSCVIDELWDDLEDKDCRIMPTEKDVTIAWNIWHITRIEDITVNMLVNKSEQILDSVWLQNLGIQVTDTANAMTDEEIISFSQNINLTKLRNYRDTVGMQTQKILRSLNSTDMKRKIERDSLDRILLEGGVTEHPDSLWLLDFWGRKDVAGIILMPITRHQIVHLNDCMKLKKAIIKKNSMR